MHEQLDGCLAALQALGDNPSMAKKDEAAWRRYWVPLTELLEVARKLHRPRCHLAGGTLAVQGLRQAAMSSGKFGVCT
eukprot:3554541-Pleurochrysis_carterae.AAC.1